MTSYITEKNERKLEYFSDIIMQEVEKKKNDANFKLETELRQHNSATLEITARDSNQALQAKQDQIHQQANRQITTAKVRAMAQYVQTRNQQIDLLFVAVMAQLAQFTQQAEYETYLIERINKTKTISSFSIVKLSPLDMRLEETIKTATNLTPETGNDDFIGGFILLNENRTIQIDYTFKTKLAIIKKDFDYSQQAI